MKRLEITLYSAIIAMATLFSACESNIYEPTSKLISYVGRVDKSNPNYVSFSYPGVTIRSKFRGQSISARFRDFADANAGMHNTFYCIIDDGEPTKIVLNETQYEYPLATHLKDTVHSVELIKLTESIVGEVGFCGFILGNPADEPFLIYTEKLPSLKMEFIGNSITCGYGNELSSMTPKQGFSPMNENNYLAFGAITARSLNAQYVCTAYSGRGVCRNYEGDSENLIPQIYNRIIPTRPETKWNHQDYIPDIIVLNMGTNDFGAETTTGIKVDSIQFISEYTAFLHRLKGYYPNTQIICAIGPMTNDSNKDYPDQLTRYSQYVLSAINKAGGENNKIYYFETEPQEGPYGEDYHPTISTHQKMAKELVSFIIAHELI